MDNLPFTDKNFPAWLTMSWAWEQSMDDSGDVKAMIAWNLRRLREKRGLSQKSLAKLAEVRLITLKATESAKILPDIGLIWKLAKVLDVPCTAFLSSAHDA
jgi:DNA-binding XRE family transcriptional regulator